MMSISDILLLLSHLLFSGSYASSRNSSAFSTFPARCTSLCPLWYSILGHHFLHAPAPLSFYNSLFPFLLFQNSFLKISPAFLKKTVAGFPLMQQHNPLSRKQSLRLFLKVFRIDISHHYAIGIIRQDPKGELYRQTPLGWLFAVH